MGHLKTLDLIVIAAYMAGVLGVGWWSSRRQHDTEEYFVGSRSMHPLVAGISIIASLVSTISYLSNPGEMVKNGPSWAWQMLHAPISFVVVGFFIIPHIMKHKVTSGYQLLEQKFGMGVRQAAAILFILSRIFWMGLVIFTCGFAASQVSGLPLSATLLTVGVIGMLYTVLGGIRAVMVTDVIQFIILIGGAWLSVAFIAVKTGGLTAWWPDWTSAQLSDLNWQRPKLLSLNPFDRLSVLSVALYGCSFWILTATGDQVVIQRFLSTRDARAARRSFGISILGDWLTSATLFITGLALVGFYLRFPAQLPDPSMSLPGQADELFPHFIAAILPAGLTGLLVAALFAAAMSSLDSGISSISTVLITDFSGVFTHGCDTDAARLARARWVGVGVGCVATAMSFAVSLVPGNNLLEVTVRVSSLLAAPLFVAFVLAFFDKRSTPAGAWAAIATGAILAIGLTYSGEILALFTGETRPISITLIMPVSSLAAITAGIAVSRFTKTRETNGTIGTYGNKGTDAQRPVD
ncbi:MAG: sodium/solute symporter [Candidatus Hydrogenedentes bacterium]|nr:sodium/solute symporter [Candidatus Hydrogenedentota bacterium]